MSVPLQQRQYSLVGNMSQIMMDLLSSLTNCIYCFPGSPSLKINNRSFKMQHLLGEVSSTHSPNPIPILLPPTTNPPQKGRFLLRLLSPRHHNLHPLRPQKDPLPLRSRIRRPRPQRSRSLHPLHPPPQHHPRDRPLCRLRQRPLRPCRKNSLHPPPLLPPRQPPRRHQRQPSQPHQIPRTPPHDPLPWRCARVESNA